MCTIIMPFIRVPKGITSTCNPPVFAEALRDVVSQCKKHKIWQ